MWNKKQPDKGMSTLAVLAAAAREAEELLAEDADLEDDAIAEANRRLALFMRTARELAG